jgi:hypothetical protein
VAASSRRQEVGTEIDKVECGKVVWGEMAWSTIPFIGPRRGWGGEGGRGEGRWRWSFKASVSEWKRGRGGGMMLS